MIQIETKLQAIRVALDMANDPAEDGPVYFCHGGGKCELSEEDQSNGCDWCHIIQENDPRDPWQVKRDMERQIDGH
jgi:hypothetical protein